MARQREGWQIKWLPFKSTSVGLQIWLLLIPTASSVLSQSWQALETFCGRKENICLVLTQRKRISISYLLLLKRVDDCTHTEWEEKKGSTKHCPWHSSASHDITCLKFPHNHTACELGNAKIAAPGRIVSVIDCDPSSNVCMCPFT